MPKQRNPFPKFDRYVCDGDHVEFTDAAGITFVARIERDDNHEAPDQRSDGFWPNIDQPDSAGFIGLVGHPGKDRRRLAAAMSRAEHVMATWRRDEWWYVGVCVTAWKAGVQLTGDYDHAIWGVEANYPTGRGHPNRYLRECAFEQLEECRLAAADKLLQLRK
jgi:hypothetical protein